MVFNKQGDLEMKKFVTLIPMLCMILSLSACGKVEITMQEIYGATNIPALLEKHDSVYVLYTQNGEVYQEEYYSKEYCYTFLDGELYEMESDWASLITNHSYHYCYDNTYTQGILLTPPGVMVQRRT